MSRRWIVISLVVLAAAGLAAAFTMGSLASIDSSTPRTAEKELDLNLIILVNRLQLTPEQLAAVRERIAEVVDKARAVEARRDAFAKELLTFAGNEEALDTKLAAFQKEMNGLRKDLATTARENIDELKGVLTIRQGEVLREALPNWIIQGGTGGALRAQGQTGLGPNTPGGRQVEQWGFDVLPSAPQTGSQGAKKGALVQQLGPMVRQLAEKAPKLAERLSQLQELEQEDPGAGAILKSAFSRRTLEKLEELLDILNQRAALRAA
jgi:hypothetical protein